MQVGEDAPLVGNGKPGNKYGFIATHFSFLYKLKRHAGAIKVASVFIVLLLAIIAFAMATEDEVNYIFALDAQSPTISTSSRPYCKFS